MAASGVAGAWDVTSVLYDDGIRSVIVGTTLTATFGADGHLSGSSGCNTFRGDLRRYEIDVEIEGVSSTIVRSRAGDALLIDSRRLHQIQRFGGANQHGVLIGEGARDGRHDSADHESVAGDFVRALARRSDRSRRCFGSALPASASGRS